MPPVDVAMARSLRGGLLGSVKDGVARSLTAAVVRRDIISNAEGKVSEIQRAFSSWGNCMSFSFCKWPVIALIAIGGLIVFSILICVIRCACCGVSCCCSCCYCLKCCGNCCGCCDPPGGKAHKYLDEPSNPSQQQGHGYRQQAPMEAHFPTASEGPFYSAPSHGPPQYAEFDVSRKHDADALPAMPSWEASGSKKIMHEEEGVELDHLQQKGPEYGGFQQISMGRNDPYSQSRGNSPSYMNAYGQQPARPHGGHLPDGYNLDQPYDVPIHHSSPTMGRGPGQQSPPPNQYEYGVPRQITPAHMQPIARELDEQSYPVSYGMESRARNSPGPGQMQGRSSGPGTNSPRPVPYRTYTPTPQSGPGSPITNNAGFDFNSGYSRPLTGEGPNYDRRPSESKEHEEHEGYPGYKPYGQSPHQWNSV